MARYIETGELLDSIKNCDATPSQKLFAACCVAAAPTADVAPKSEVIEEFVKLFENAFSELQEFFNEDTYENLVASNDVLNLLDKIEKQMKGAENETDICAKRQS